MLRRGCAAACSGSCPAAAPQASLPAGRINLAAATGPDGRIYAIGGEDSSFEGTDQSTGGSSET